MAATGPGASPGVLLVLACVAVAFGHDAAISQQRFTVPPQVLRSIRLRADSSNTAPRLVTRGSSAAIPGNLSTLQLARGQFIAVKAPSVITVHEGRAREVLPVRFIGPDATGQMLHLAPVVEVEQRGLRLDEQGRRYRATVGLGLDDLAHPGENRPLPAGTSVQVLSDGADVDPRDVSFGHTNPPYERVGLSAVSPPDSVTLRLLMSFTPDRVTKSIAVLRPRAVIEGVPEKLAGWGVGTAEFHISLSDDAGEDAREVRLRASAGRVEPATVQVSRSRSQGVRYRSSGLGAVTVEAAGTGLGSDERRILLVFPTMFFAASLVGGGLGALARKLVQRKRHRSASAMLRYIGGGLLVGLIVAGAFLLGVNLTGVAIPPQSNELAVALISAIGAIGAGAVVDRLAGAGKS
jgi:hypothetical protein